MSIVSQLELPGSPVEQASWSQSTYYWDPSAELQAGETISAPTCTVYEYDPSYAQNVGDSKDVTSTVLAAGSPAIGSGAYANMVQVVISANVLVPGYIYQVRLGCTGSAGSTPARFFRVRCKV